MAKVIANFGMTVPRCNIGVINAFKEVFGKDLPLMNANDMTKYWKNNPESWQKITLSQAQGLANEGYFVVAGWVNPSGGSGHVVVVVPGDATYGNWNKSYILLPNVMDTGSGRRIESFLINQGFGKDKHSTVEFYMYK